MAINPPSAEEMARNVVAVEKIRARNLDGTLKADDPSTPDVNEAWAPKPGKPKKATKPKKAKE